MMERRGRRRKQLLDDLKEKRRYWKLKEEAPDHTVWRTRFGRGYGPFVRQTTKSMNGQETSHLQGIQTISAAIPSSYSIGIRDSFPMSKAAMAHTTHPYVQAECTLCFTCTYKT
jgi:hypothetical protein